MLYKRYIFGGIAFLALLGAVILYSTVGIIGTNKGSNKLTKEKAADIILKHIKENPSNNLLVPIGKITDGVYRAREYDLNDLSLLEQRQMVKNVGRDKYENSFELTEQGQRYIRKEGTEAGVVFLAAADPVSIEIVSMAVSPNITEGSTATVEFIVQYESTPFAEPIPEIKNHIPERIKMNVTMLLYDNGWRVR